jgi:hypothetical protein
MFKKQFSISNDQSPHTIVKIRSTTAILASLVATAACAAVGQAAPSFGFHVSPTGQDSNPGTLEKPFATLEKARDSMRGKKGGTVVIHGGTYTFKKPFELTAEDSGTKETPVRYIAAKGETPVFTSARGITGWKLADAATPSLAESAKGNVFVADVPKGWRFHFLYVNGQSATRSRSVNHENWRQWGRDFSFGPATPTGQPVTFHNKELVKGLPSNGDVEMCTIIYQFGVMGGGVMTDFDPEKGTALWHSKQLNLHEARGGQETAFRLENALAFTDEPGEWAVDSAAGKVYYWPKPGEDMAKASIVAPTLNRLVSVTGDDAKKQYVRHIEFSGLTLVCTDRMPENQWPDHWPVRQWENPDATIFMEGVEDCAVRDCRLYRCGAYGITFLRHALRNEVSSCEIGWTGSGGVQLFGFGAGYRDENKYNIVRRNYIHDQGCSIYWHSPNVQIYGSGNNVVELNFLALSAYNNVSISGVRAGDLNDWKTVQAGRLTMITDSTAAFSVDFSTYPPEVLEQVKAGKEYFNMENYRELAIHSRNNRIARNIAFECHTRLEEGGALYTWCPGKGTQLVENVIYKSHELPGSSVISLDDHSEYLTVTGNVVWCEGRAGCGTIGVRDQEKGNVFTGNIRSFDKYGDAKLCEGEPGHEKFDALHQSIKAEVDKAGGWPGNPDLNAMIEKLKNSKDRFELTPEQVKAMNKMIK